MEKILYSLSEISLVGGLAGLLFGRFFGEKSLKSIFGIAKGAVLASLFFGIMFYNKTAFPNMFEASAFSTLFYTLCAAVAFVWLSLSYRWFTSMNLPAVFFCSLSLAAILCCRLVILTSDIGVLFAGLSGLALINYLFLKFSQEAEEFHQISTRYGWSIVLFMGLMAVALIILTPENWSYEAVAEFMAVNGLFKTLLVIAGVLFFLFFLMSIAPFHFGTTDAIAPAVLPVAAYLSVVPCFALWAVLIKITPVLMAGADEQRYSWYMISGCLSMLIGAVGAHTTRNIKKILHYAGLCCCGLILLGLAVYTEDAVLGALVLLQTYVLVVLGIYACFYGFKSSREYLNNLSMLNGIAVVRPYMASAIFFYILSLAGLVPLPGFIGQFSILGLLSADGFSYAAAIALIAFLIVGAALLRIVAALYFADRSSDYDRPDHSIYLYLVLIGLLIVLLVYKPEFLINNAVIILNSIGGGHA